MQEKYSIESMLFAIFITLIVSFGVGLFFKRKPKEEPAVESQEQEEKEKKQPVKVDKKLLEAKHLRWDTQDWIWMISFLLYAQLFTVLYKEMVMNVVSYVSTFVSTALGAVAIYISVREATKIDKTKDDMNTILGELREKLSQMDVKINRIDPETRVRRDNEIEEFKAKLEVEMKSWLEKNLSDTNKASKEEILSIINNKVNIAAEELKESLNDVEIENNFMPNIKIGNELESELKYLNLTLNQMIKSLKVGASISIDEIKTYGYKNFNIKFNTRIIAVKLQSFVNRGFLRREEGIYIRI